jgi:hypothetical protein
MDVTTPSGRGERSGWARHAPRQTEVVGRVTFCVDRVQRQEAGVLHGGAHPDAIRVLLVLPGGLKSPSGRREPGRSFCSAGLFFGSRHHSMLNQALPACSACTRSHGHSNASGRRTCRRCAPCRSGCRLAGFVLGVGFQVFHPHCPPRRYHVVKPLVCRLWLIWRRRRGARRSGRSRIINSWRTWAH